MLPELGGDYPRVGEIGAALLVSEAFPDDMAMGHHRKRLGGVAFFQPSGGCPVERRGQLSYDRG